MCLTIPGKIIEIKSDNVIIDYGNEKRKAKIIEGNFKVGDYVFVQNSIVIEKVPIEAVEKWLDMMRESENEICDEGA